MYLNLRVFLNFLRLIFLLVMDPATKANPVDPVVKVTVSAVDPLDVKTEQ